MQLACQILAILTGLLAIFPALSGRMLAFMASRSLGISGAFLALYGDWVGIASFLNDIYALRRSTV